MAKEWIKNVKMDVKEGWENKYSGDKVFIVAKDLYYPEKEWELWYETRNNEGLDIMKSKTFKNKELALEAVKKYMSKKAKKEVYV